MPREESLYPADWLRIAEKDLGRVVHLLNVYDPDAAGFYLQQAVEKYLKAFLLSKGWRLERIHDLETLLNDAVTYAPILEPFRPVCQKITAFYFVEQQARHVRMDDQSWFARNQAGRYLEHAPSIRERLEWLSA
jgi:HEPN domain-containing protein